MTIINDVQFVEVDDYHFRLSFLYDEKNLETVALSKTATEQEVRDALAMAIDSYEQRAAKQNYRDLKDIFRKNKLEL